MVYIKRRLLRYYITYVRNPKGRQYLARLIKASFLILIAPTMVISIFIIYRNLSVVEGILGIAAVFILSLIFTKPYLADLSALTRYVELLAKDQKAQAPALSFLSNVEALSTAVNTLHKQWSTRKLQLEAMLVESRILFDTLPDILIMLGDDLTIIRANNTAHSIFRKNLHSLNFKDIISPTSSLIENTLKVIEEGEKKTFEIFLPAPIHRFFVVHIERFPIYSPAGIRVIVIMHDVTETKRIEQAFTDFVANASHEIRTPLTSLVGFIEALQTSAKDDPEAQEHFLSIMSEQAAFMSKLVSDLFSLSKLQMRVHTAPTETINIADIIEQSVNQIKWSADENNVTLDVQCGQDLIMIGDEGELISLCDNLLSNAIKYGKKNSTVTICAVKTTDTPEECEHLKQGAPFIQLSVTDQGEGISSEHLPRLTERFYRVDKARSRTIGGIGLGLSIVQHVIDRHQGALTVHSEIGKGSTFTAYFASAG